VSKPLYLEADEDITSAIDKLKQIKDSSVSIVVPKRSTLLQSVINQKLLKKAAADSGKELVLVTNDKTALNLAARVGLPVASNLKSQPSVPDVESAKPEESNEVMEGDASDLEPEAVKAPEPVDRVKSESSAKPVIQRRPITESADQVVPEKSHGPRVPDFNALQKRLLYIIGGVLLVISLVGLNYWFKKATVTLFAKGTKVAADFTFTVDPNASKTDGKAAILGGQKRCGYESQGNHNGQKLRGHR
jgi:hypothetical protein